MRVPVDILQAAELAAQEEKRRADFAQPEAKAAQP